jgi:outer membrane protein assembly factor BamB
VSSLRVVASLAFTVAVPVVAGAAPPGVAPGWPVPAASGYVHVGIGDSPVVIAESTAGITRSSVTAFDATGQVRWRTARLWGCGNCDDGPQTPTRQPGGSYGPIGPEGDSPWSVRADGTVADACTGVVLGDRNCVEFAVKTTQGSELTPSLVSRGSTPWEYAPGVGPWTPEFDVPPVVVSDRNGGVYWSFGDRASSTVPLRLSAVDRLGVPRWELPGEVPVAGLAEGVLATDGVGRLAAYAANASPRWTTAWAFGDTLLTDVPRGAVYVSRGPGSANGRVVIALDASTGEERWRTAARDRARILSVDGKGEVYVAIDRPGRHGLRAIGPDGHGRWQFDTATPVGSAHRLPDASVAFTTVGVGAWPSEKAALLWKIRPRQPHARPVRSADVTLSRTSFRSSCGDETGCADQPSFGTIIRLALPRGGTLQILMVGPKGQEIATPETIQAPAGISYIRFIAGSRVKRGRNVIRVSGRVGGLLLNRSIPVTIIR